MLKVLWLSIASIGPGLLWLWYFYRQDRYEPEPLKMIFKVFLAGILLVIPAGLLEQIWRGQIMSSVQNAQWPSFLAMAFLVIAPIEEGLKTGFLWWLVRRSKELNEPVDGVIYGITLGLGFASLENFLWASTFGYGVAALRAVVTTLAHASFTGWVGYFIGQSKLQPEKNRFGIWPGFLLALAGHGLYDFLLFLRSPVAALLAFFVIIGLLARLYQVMQNQVANSPFRK
jgi:protease PrsW